MDSMKKKKLIDNSLTYGLVIACWAVVQIMMATGHMTSLMKGLLVPLCMYVILAVSLNLTVGILGELSLGHAGFMCVGAFSGAFFTKLTAEAIPNLQVRFILALIIGALVAAESVGINITKYKLMAFSISASLAGVAGVLYAHNLSSLAATPKSFGYNMSIMILVYVVLGGIGNIRGSIIAAVILTLLPELLRGLNNYRMLIYAVVLIVMMLFNSAPKAIAMRERIMEKFHKKNAKEAA